MQDVITGMPMKVSELVTVLVAHINTKGDGVVYIKMVDDPRVNTVSEIAALDVVVARVKPSSLIKSPHAVVLQNRLGGGDTVDQGREILVEPTMNDASYNVPVKLSEGK